MTTNNDINNIRWRGFDYKDGQRRLIEQEVGDGIRDKRMKSRGRVITTFQRDTLIKVAWEIGVSNPNGDNINLFDINLEKGFEIFLDGWRWINRNLIANDIWNRLIVIGGIIEF